MLHTENQTLKYLCFCHIDMSNFVFMSMFQSNFIIDWLE